MPPHPRGAWISGGGGCTKPSQEKVSTKEYFIGISDSHPLCFTDYLRSYLKENSTTNLNLKKLCEAFVRLIELAGYLEGQWRRKKSEGWLPISPNSFQNKPKISNPKLLGGKRWLKTSTLAPKNSNFPAKLHCRADNHIYVTGVLAGLVVAPLRLLKTKSSFNHLNALVHLNA